MLRRDTRDAALWHDVGEGREEAVLFDAPWERVVLLRLAGSHVGGVEVFPHGAEYFIVEGDLIIDSVPRRVGTWWRLPPGSSTALASDSGALLYRKTGHLG